MELEWWSPFYLENANIEAWRRRDHDLSVDQSIRTDELNDVREPKVLTRTNETFLNRICLNDLKFVVNEEPIQFVLGRQFCKWQHSISCRHWLPGACTSNQNECRGCSTWPSFIFDDPASASVLQTVGKHCGSAPSWFCIHNKYLLQWRLC